MNWKLESGEIINLIHIDNYKDIPNGTELYDIFGKKYIKGKDYIDNDTRGGYLAFGILIKRG